MNLYENGTYALICTQDTIIKAVKQVTQHHSTRHLGVERRSEPRHPYLKLVELTPFDDNDFENLHEPILVAGKQLGSRGFDFFHREPISFRNALITFPVDDEETIQFVLKIDWCRFLGPDWYESGGRFTKLVKELLNQSSDHTDNSMSYANSTNQN